MITTICIEQRILVLDVLQENSITLTSDFINLDFSNGCWLPIFFVLFPGKMKVEDKVMGSKLYESYLPI